ncbi:MAG: DUF4399 domain-containing protein, partial [Myxococcales bacterium]|nr:DUF4399 domain-containing protein [Myxococcales bacterium]
MIGLRKTTTLFIIGLLAASLGLTGCGKKAETAKKVEPTATKSAKAAGDGLVVPKGASVMFVSPKDGAEIVGPVVDGKVAVAVSMGAKGIKVQPAGKVEAGTGHHHIIISAPATPQGQAVPADATHIHYGKGQTEATLQLAPGKHKLTMQFANGAHLSYGPKLSASITVTVKAGAAAAAPAPAAAAPAADAPAAAAG